MNGFKRVIRGTSVCDFLPWRTAFLHLYVSQNACLSLAVQQLFLRLTVAVGTTAAVSSGVGRVLAVGADQVADLVANGSRSWRRAVRMAITI